MSTATTTKFERTVRSRLIENKLAHRKPDSIRGLARSMGEGDKGRADTFKRSLFKWMDPNGPKPAPASCALVARHLPCEVGELVEDDEEPHPVSLDDFLRQRIEQLVRETHGAPGHADELATQSSTRKKEEQ